MEWLLLLMAGGTGSYAVWRIREVRAARQLRLRELDQARTIAEEDVTVFGEQLQQLGIDVGDRPLDSGTRASYQVALDAYEHAKWEAPRLREPDQLSTLVDTLGSGRYAMACVRAALAGQPPPQLRVPCFFNPQHGPSVTDVQWTPTGRGTRRLPACRRCAAQVRARERPEIRMVTIGSLRVPYWEAGSVTLPYSYGYFAAGQIAGPRVSWVIDSALTGDWDMGHWTDYGKRDGRR